MCLDTVLMDMYICVCMYAYPWNRIPHLHEPGTASPDRCTTLSSERSVTTVDNINLA